MIRIRYRAALLAIGALALAGGLAGVTQPPVSSAAHSAPELPANALLPNLGALPPRDIDIVQVRVKNSVEKRLRFDTLMANTGEGPLEVFPGGTGTTLCPTHASLPTQEAWQRVYIDDNQSTGFQRTKTVLNNSAYAPDGYQDRFVGCMVLHPKHRHWHVEGFAAYRLYDVANNNLVASSEKVSFCMLDMERVPGAGVTVAAPYYITCGRNATMGISAGWADEYYSGLADQWIVINGILDGDYCLVNIANIAALEPTGHRTGLIESPPTYASNASGVRINISNNGTTVKPSGTACSPP